MGGSKEYPKRGDTDEGVPSGGDSNATSTSSMNSAARVRTLGSASGIFAPDSCPTLPPPLVATSPELGQPSDAGGNSGSVMAGLFGEDGEDTDCAVDGGVSGSHGDSISRALDTDRRIADATSELLGSDFNDSIEGLSTASTKSPIKKVASTTASLPVSHTSFASNDDDASTITDLDSVTGEELTGLHDEELIKGLLELRDIVREARISNRNESDGALSFLEAFDDVVESISSCTADGVTDGDMPSAIASIPSADDSAASNTGPSSPSSVSSYEQKVVADRHLHRRMMSRDGRQAFDKALQTEAEAMTSKRAGKITMPPSHPIRKVLPYVPHLHAIFVKLYVQLTWLTGEKSSIEHKAVASRIVQLLEYMADQISVVISQHEDTDAPSIFADTASSVTLDFAAPSAVAVSISDLLNDGDTKEVCVAGDSINAAITSFRLILSVLGDGSCIIESTQEGSTQKQSIESEENYLRMMALHNEMEHMVELDGGDDLNPMNQRGALAAMKLGKLSMCNAQAGDEPSTTNTRDSNRSALKEDLTVEALRDLLEWMTNVDVILTDLTGPLASTVIQSQSLRVKHDAVDYLLHTTIPEILSVDALEAAESITAIVAAFIRKRRKLMELLPVGSNVEKTDELDVTEADNSFISRARSIMAGKSISRKNKSRITLFLSVLFAYLNYMQSIPPSVCVAIATLLVLVLSAKRFSANQHDSRRPEALALMFDFFPELPEHCLPREDVQRQLIKTITNGRDDLVDDSVAPDFDTGVTIVCGAPGSGKTTLVNMIVRRRSDDIIHEAFPDGAVWLTFDTSLPRVDYPMLITIYGQICKQLSSTSLSRKLADLASSFDADLYSLRPEAGDDDETRLMIDLQKDFFTHLQLSTRRVLFVLDGLHDISDVQWFRSIKRSGKFGALPSNQRYWRSHVLVTSSTPMQNELASKHRLHWSRIVEMPLLSDVESNEVLVNESSAGATIRGLDSFIARGRDWAYSPLSLGCLGRFSCGAFIVYGSYGMDAVASSSAALLKHLTLLSQQACSSEEERTFLVVEASLRHLFTSMGGVGSVLRLCFSAFVALFFDSATPWSSINENYVPATIATIFWDGLLNSDDIPVGYLMDVEKCLAAADDGVSRSSYVANCLVSLGLLRRVSFNSGSRGKATGYAVEHDILIKAGLKLSRESRADSLDTDDDVARRKRSWSVFLVHGYQEYLGGIGSRRERWSNDYAYHEETHFIMRHIITHMFLGSMGDKALELLTSETFIQNRLKQLGLLRGTLQHIADTEHLVQILREQGELVALSGKRVLMATAKLSLINSFERIAAHLTQVPGNYIEDFIKASAGLYLLGKSLMSQHWTKEAFLLFQESINLCHVVLAYDRRSRNLVYRILARALYQVGEIHKEKGDIGESIKNCTESLHYCNSARHGYKSIELDAMRSLRSLGEAHFLSGDVPSALKAHNRCLVAIESQYGRDHQQFAEGLQNIGIMYMKGKDATKAKQFFLDALQIRRDLLGPESMDVAVSLHFLGIVHRDLGDNELAFDAFSESIRVWKTRLHSGSGDDDRQLLNIRYASTTHELGLLHRQRGEIKEALQAYKKALILRQTYLGNEHEETAQTLHCMGVAYCDIGAHENAMKAYARSLQLQKKFAYAPRSPHSNESGTAMKSFTNVLWASQCVRADAPSPEAIMNRCTSLFGSDIENSCCAAARIFACSSLLVDDMIQNESNTVEKKTKRNGRHMEWLESILPFMKAAVQAEMAVDAKARKESNPTSPDSTRKLLRFCSFDFSSVNSPIDMVVGSNEQLEHSIDALEVVVREIVRQSTRSTTNSSARAKLLLVLYAMTTVSEGKAIREACAKTMPNDHGRPWPSTRFIKASELYRAELEAMVASSGKEETSNVEDTAIVLVSPLRDRFSTQIGSAIRFHLRRLFDPVPMFFTLPSKHYQPPDLSDCRAKTYEIVYLRAPDGIEASTDGSSGPAPLWDRPISHVFNLALQRTYSYYEIIDEIKAALGGGSFGSSPSFVLSQASQRCLEGRSKDIREMDIDDILKDISMAHICLTAARATKFVVSLLRWPGVAEAIGDAGGWVSIENLAGKIGRFHLDKDFPDEAHLAQLSNIENLLSKLDADRSDMLVAARASQKVLHDMWKRFKRGGGRMRRRHTYDSVVRQVLLDDSRTAVFPQLGAPGQPSQ